MQHANIAMEIGSCLKLLVVIAPEHLLYHFSQVYTPNPGGCNTDAKITLGYTLFLAVGGEFGWCNVTDRNNCSFVFPVIFL
jgi:hypothetical protein